MKKELLSINDYSKKKRDLFLGIKNILSAIAWACVIVAVLVVTIVIIFTEEEFYQSARFSDFFIYGITATILVSLCLLSFIIRKRFERMGNIWSIIHIVNCKIYSAGIRLKMIKKSAPNNKEKYYSQMKKEIAEKTKKYGKFLILFGEIEIHPKVSVEIFSDKDCETYWEEFNERIKKQSQKFQNSWTDEFFRKELEEEKDYGLDAYATIMKAIRSGKCKPYSFTVKQAKEEFSKFLV